MKLGVIFNGQGAHRMGMGLDFVDKYDKAKATFEQFEALSQIPLRQWIEVENHRFSQTRYAQIAIVATSLAIYRSIQDLLPEVCDMAGLSLGEYSALIASEMLLEEKAVPLLLERGEMMSQYCEKLLQINPSKMLAVMGVSRQAIEYMISEAQLQEQVFLANLNASWQTVLAGTTSGIDLFMTIAKSKGVKKMISLKVEGPFHSPLMEPVCQEYQKILEKVEFRDSDVSVISNVTVQPHDKEIVRELLVKHLIAPVRWQETIEKMVANGVTHLIQIGPGNTLSQLLKREINVPKCYVVDRVEDIEMLRVFLSEE